MRIVNYLNAFLLIYLTVGCGCINNDKESIISWEYPIALGDSRARAHEFLSIIDYPAEYKHREEYPTSGLIVYYDSEDRLTEILFRGDAGIINKVGSTPSDWIPPRVPFFNGITASSNEDDFKRVLGSPVREYEYKIINDTAANSNKDDSKHTPDSRIREATIEEMLSDRIANIPKKFRSGDRKIWKTEGYIIEASFLNSDTTEGEKVLNAGSLLWCSVSRGF